MKSYYIFILYGWLYSLTAYGQEAVFYKSSKVGNEVSYDAFANLKFGKLFCSHNEITILTTDANHQHKSTSTSLEAIRLKWNFPIYSSSDFIFKDLANNNFTRIINSSKVPTSQTYIGYKSISSSLANSGITQIWTTNHGDLAFELLGKGKAHWVDLTFSLLGASHSLTKDGIRIKAKLGSIILTPPITRIKRNGIWQIIPSAYERRNGNTYGFALPPYISSADSVWIDPQLIFSGYSGSVSDNWGCTATYDANGNTLLAGIAFSLGFPTTLGAYQRSYANPGDDQISVDVAIQKFSPNGRELLSSTYFGGTGSEVPHSIVCNSFGELIIFGTTSSPDLPVTTSSVFHGGSTIDPYDEDYLYYTRGSDFFVSRFNPSLTALLASTYVGGGGNEGLNPCIAGLAANYGDEFRGSVDVDQNGDIYIGGSTISNDFPTLRGFQTQYGGGGDGVLCKLDRNMRLLYSTYVGGSGTETLNSLTLGPNGQVGFCGGTTSTNLTVTNGAYQTTPSIKEGSPLNQMDAFAGITTLQAGVVPHYITYSATPSYDQAYFADFDAVGRLVILGQTLGAMPYTTNSTAGNATGGLFIQKFDADGRNLDLAFRFGSMPGGVNISPTAFQVDECDQIYFSGWGGDLNSSISSCRYLPLTTSGLPVTNDAVRSRTDGADFYVCVLQPGAIGLKYATFFGSNGAAVEHVDGGTSRFDPRGFIYQAVCAGCGGNSSFPSTPGVYSRLNRSNNCNQAAFKIDLTPLYLPFKASVVPSTACPGDILELIHNGQPVAGSQLDLGDGRVSLLPISPFTFSYNAAGTYHIKATGPGPGCPNLGSDTVVVHIKNGVPHINDTNALYCIGDTLPFDIAQRQYQINWSPSTFLSTDTGYHVEAAPLYNIKYKVRIANRETGCADSLTVKLNARPIAADPVIETLPDPCHGITNLKLYADGTADTTSWQLNNTIYTEDTLRLNFTVPSLDTVNLYRSLEGCKGAANLPIDVAVRHIILPKETKKDSSLAGCKMLSYKYNLLDSDSASVRWIENNQILSYSNTYAPEPSLSSKRILVKIYKQGCVDSVQVDHNPVEIKIPNIVTKNGDMSNDTFQPLHLPLTASLTLYDRWGRTIVSSQAAYKGYNFDNQATGVYYFLIEDSSTGNCKGWIELIK